MISPLGGITRDDVDRAERSQWRYRALLPVHFERPVSLGEGCTPMLATEVAGSRCSSNLSGSIPPRVSKIAVPR
jgi:threonine synthase